MKHHLRSPVKISHDILVMLFLAEAGFSEVTEQWQPISGDNYMAGVDCALRTKYLSRRGFLNLRILKTREILWITWEKQIL
ncbi:hypothetical protein AlacWU_09038 [Aspergillus niger]|nr:hypothetical protein AlacWU_09038 [Aspergillus niger]